MMNLKSYTQSAIKLRELILLTLLGVVMYVSQVVMAPLPNIEIVSILIIITARKFGVKSLLAVYIFVGCEILTYGISMWVINYLYVWAVLCIIVCLIRGIDNIWVYTLINALYGLFFGILCSVPYFLVGGIGAGIASIISGLPFDLAHCAGNFVTALFLYKPLTTAINKAIK